MKKTMMIDYHNDNGTICRKEMDDCEFCVRDGNTYFISDGWKYCIPLEQVIQVYMN